MRNHKILSTVLFALALMLTLATAVLSFSGMDRDPVLVSQPVQARQTAERLLEAVSRGDLEAVRACLAGNPSLGDRQEPADPVGQLLWQEFLESFSYELEGECYASQSGVTQDVTVSYLDYGAVFAPLGERARKLLNRRVGQAESMDEIYDEHNQYREELVQQVLTQALRQTVEENPGRITRQLSLQMTYDGAGWRVLPDGDVLDILSGGTAG